MLYTVKKGMRYYAQIRLSGFEALATNAQIANKFTNVGFTDVSVTGSGSYRGASGTWTHSDKSATLPSEVYHVELVGSVDDGGGKATEEGTGGGAA